MESIYEIFAIFWPLILSLIAITISIFLSPSTTSKVIGLNFLNFNIPITLRKDTYVRVLLIILTLGLVIYFFVRDYSSFFPNRLTYDVFYDLKGLNTALESIKPILDKNTSISPKWQYERASYFQHMDKIIKKKFHDIKVLFSYDKYEDYLVSKGTAEHGVQYFGFWQKYKIIKISGEINHFLYPPEMKAIKLRTSYNLLDRPENIIEPKIGDFFRGKIIVKPTMAQSLMILSEEIYEADIVGLTEVRFFPYNTLNKTIFCFKTENGLVPLAYTIYKEE